MTETTTNSTASTACWSCGAEPSGAHFCPACGRIQLLPPETDYFAFFGLPQKLGLAPAELERKFHELSWRLHPDNFVRASERERALSMERAALLNDAFRTLREPVRRVEYLLARHGMRKEGSAKQQAPPELLEEVFELNESLEELRAGRARSLAAGDLDGLRRKLEGAGTDFARKLAALDTQLEGLFADWDNVMDSGADQARGRVLLDRMNELLNRRSYIRNLVATVQKELAEA